MHNPDSEWQQQTKGKSHNTLARRNEQHEAEKQSSL